MQIICKQIQIPWLESPVSRNIGKHECTLGIRYEFLHTFEYVMFDVWFLLKFEKSIKLKPPATHWGTRRPIQSRLCLVCYEIGNCCFLQRRRLLQPLPPPPHLHTHPCINLHKRGGIIQYLEYHSVSPFVRFGSPAPFFPLASVSPLLNQGGGDNTRSRVRGQGRGGAHSDDWRESLALCLLCMYK